MTASSGSCTTLSAPNVGSGGNPRVFQGDALYIYGAFRGLSTSKDGGTTWNGILPTGAIYVNAIAQTSGSGMYSNTVVISDNLISKVAKYQSSQMETAAGWTSSGSFAKAFEVTDAIAYYDTIPVIVGGGASTLAGGAGVKIGTSQPPYTFTDGGTGIVSWFPLTDLDAPL